MYSWGDMYDVLACMDSTDDKDDNNDNDDRIIYSGDSTSKLFSHTFCIRVQHE
jgi:hypothetical protein